MRYGRVGKFKVQVTIIVEGGSGRDDMIAKKTNRSCILYEKEIHTVAVWMSSISLSLSGHLVRLDHWNNKVNRGESRNRNGRNVYTRMKKPGW